jgi:hypothetical protein
MHAELASGLDIAELVADDDGSSWIVSIEQSFVRGTLLLARCCSSLWRMRTRATLTSYQVCLPR